MQLEDSSHVGPVKSTFFRLPGVGISAWHKTLEQRLEPSWHYIVLVGL